jgi:hypothetical protein
VRTRLKVIERPGRAHVEDGGDRLLMYVPDGTDTEARAKLLGDWHRKHLRLANSAAHRSVGTGHRPTGATLECPANEDQMGLL